MERDTARSPRRVIDFIRAAGLGGVAPGERAAAEGGAHHHGNATWQRALGRLGSPRPAPRLCRPDTPHVQNAILSIGIPRRKTRGLRVFECQNGPGARGASGGAPAAPRTPAQELDSDRPPNRRAVHCQTSAKPASALFAGRCAEPSCEACVGPPAESARTDLTPAAVAMTTPTANSTATHNSHALFLPSICLFPTFSYSHLLYT